MPSVIVKGLGRVFFPDSMPVDDITSFLNNRFSDLKRVGEPALAIGSGIIAEPIAGLAGIAQTLNPFAEEGSGAQAVMGVQEALTFQPRTQEGKEGLQAVSESIVGQFGEVIGAAEQKLGDAAFDLTGSPLVAAGAATLPSAVLEALGLRQLSKAGRLSAKANLGTLKSIIGGAGLDADKVFKVKIGGPDHKITPEGRLLKFNANRNEWIDLTGTPGEANVRKSLSGIDEAGSLEAFEAGSADKLKRLKESIDAERILQDETYKVQHQAPTITDGSGVSGVDINNVFPDIYTGNAERFYGTGLKYDKKALKVIQSMKGKPGKDITIYRAVPDTFNEINPGDWVATTREYAIDHLGDEKNWHILTKKVKARDMATDGNSIHEWGYDPIAQVDLTTRQLSTQITSNNTGVKMSLSGSGDIIILDKIIAKNAGTGAGTRAIKELIDHADSTGKTIGLTPSSDFGGSKARLTKLYKRLGFVANKGKNKNFEIQETMIRQPAP